MTKLVFVLAAIVSCVGCAASSTSRRGEELRQEVEAKQERMAVSLAASKADNVAGRTKGTTAAATSAYWLGLKETLRPLPIDPAVAARTIANLPVRDVDPDLIREGQLVAEKMRAASASVKSLSPFAILFGLPSCAEAANQSRSAIEQYSAAGKLRPVLAARYGMEFPPFNVPTP